MEKKRLLFVFTAAVLSLMVGCSTKTTSSSVVKPSEVSSANSQASADASSNAASSESSVALVKSNYGTAETPISVADAIAAMKNPAFETGDVIYVTGTVKSVEFIEKFSSYNIYLEAGEETFEIYSGKLLEGQEAPVVGATVKASGMAKVFTKDDATTYEIAYDSTTKNSPSIYSVVNPHVHAYTYEIVSEPSFDAEGKAKGVCATDNNTIDVTLKVLSDTSMWTKTTVKEATHTEEGQDKYTSAYGDVYVTTNKTAEHVGSGEYELVTDENGVVKVMQTCIAHDGAYIGEAVAETQTKVPAEFTMDFSRTNPFTQNADNENSYTSADLDGTGVASSYLILNVTKSGYIKIDYSVCSEASDKLYINISGETNKILQQGGKSSDVPNTGTVEFAVEAGKNVEIYYLRDSSVVKGSDNATITFGAPDYQYDMVKFDAKGGEVVTPKILENGKIVGELPKAKQTGKYFEGWYVDEACSTAYDGTQDLGENKTVYAKWSAAQYVTYNVGEGKPAMEATAFQIGKTPEVVDAEDTEEYYFLGWYTDEALQTPYSAANANEGFTLYAKWLAKSDAHVL